MIAIAQAIWLSLILITALPKLGFSRAGTQVATVATLILLSPLAFFVDVVMPDVFVGITVIAVIILWFCWPPERLNRAWWLSNITICVLFHASSLLLGGSLLLCLALTSIDLWRSRLIRLAIITTALLIGLFGTIGMDQAIKVATGRSVMPIPYLLARTIGDGTAAQVLRDDCPVRHYVTCRVVNQLPLSENQFLWGRPGLLGWNQLDVVTQRTIVNEQSVIVRSALLRYPVQQLLRSSWNASMMLITLDLDEFGYSDILEHSLENPIFATERAEELSGRIYLERLSLRPFSRFWCISYLIALSCISVALSVRKRLRLSPMAVQSASALLLALVLSAAIHGVLGGVWGRYTARVAWLAVLALVIICHDLWNRWHPLSLVCEPE